MTSIWIAKRLRPVVLLAVAMLTRGIAQLGVFLSNFSFSEHQLATLFLNVHGRFVCNFRFVYVQE